MDNSHISVIGDKVILVPYLPEFVPKYNSWMQDPELLQSTASEPLTLEQEYAMQRDWQMSTDKCTFLIADRNKILSPEFNIKDSLMGDVNLFINDANCGEFNVMIAETWARRKGYAVESILLMMRFAICELKCTSFIAKIDTNNKPSLCLFEDKLKFDRIKINVFNEVELKLQVTSEIVESLTNNIKYELCPYKEIKCKDVNNLTLQKL